LTRARALFIPESNRGQAAESPAAFTSEFGKGVAMKKKAKKEDKKAPKKGK